MHYFSEFSASAMRSSPITVRGWIAFALLGLCPGIGLGQDTSGQSQSLGEVAREMRKQRSATGRVRAKSLVDEEEDGPDTTGVWRVRLCSRSPCYELSITLPKAPKWTRAAEEPRPALIPIQGHEEDSSRVIRVYSAESIPPAYAAPDVAKRMFLQGWFSRPEYFGQSAHIVQDEHVQIEMFNAVVSHFSVTEPSLKYRGLSIVVGSANGNSGFACVFREEDSAAATSICDAIVKSAKEQVLEPGKRPVYADPQPYYSPEPAGDDPPDQTDDPE
jgi:hypothetical protein